MATQKSSAIGRNGSGWDLLYKYLRKRFAPHTFYMISAGPWGGLLLLLGGRSAGINWR